MLIKIILADDHKIVRDGLRSLIEKQSDMKVVAEAENGRKAVQLARELQPQVVIMDIAMSDLNGVEAASRIAAENPAIKILFLSMHSERQFVTRALQAGASGYLLKDCAWEELVNAIRRVVMNRIYLSPGITEVVVEELLRNPPAREQKAPRNSSVLTARQREIIQLIAEGKSTREISCALCLSIKTVETHRRQIMEKLGIYSIAELTKYALSEGLTFLEN